jgi:hypothetical protein
MAREAELIVNSPYLMPHDHVLQGIKAFEALVRADERALAAPVQERNFCERCGKRLGDFIHTCTPPAAKRKWTGLNEDQRNQIRGICDADIPAHVFHAIEAKLKEKNTL